MIIERLPCAQPGDRQYHCEVRRKSSKETAIERARSMNAMACGLGPIAAVMHLSKAFGANRAEILGQSTSADAAPPGIGGYVVGYVAAMFH